MTKFDSAFNIPDMLVSFPWQRNLSEYYDDVKAESSAWTESFHFFSPEGLQGFNSCDFNLLACLAYSPREREIIRLGCDLMNLFYVCDEYTDIADGKGADEIRNIIMDAFRDPHKPRPEGEFPIGEMVRDFWLRATNYISPSSSCVAHFIQEWDAYTAALVCEAQDRLSRIYRTFEEYLLIRRYSSGCMPSFALCEFGLDLPEHVFHHPVLNELRQQATDLIAIGNDMCSYAMEKSRGLELHNSVELVRKERNFNLQEAINWLEEYASHVRGGFLINIQNLPSWGVEVDKKVKVYVNGLGQWVRGNDDWSFESERYFGDKGSIVRRTRAMVLLPPSTGFVKISS